MLLGNGVYTYRDAAVLTGLRPARIREWFRCRDPEKQSVFQSDYEGRTEQSLISFLDLIEVFIAGQLREHGFSMQKLRLDYEALRDLHGQHPFAHREFRTDGKNLFLVDRDGRGHQQVVEVRTRQRVFPQIILPFLRRLDYDDISQLAVRWNIADGVVVNPGICFGQPVVKSCSIPTSILAKAVKANSSVTEVARWYEITPRMVRYAVQFEARRNA